MSSFGALRVSAICLLLANMLLAARTVELDLVASDRAPLTGAHDWARALSQFESVRVRAGASVRKSAPQVSVRGNTVRITAVIGSQNELIVPGKRFTLRQTAALKAWIDAQQSEERKALDGEKNDRFGLSSKDLKKIHQALKPPVTASTTGKNAARLVSAIEKSTSTRIDLTPEAASILARATVTSEVNGLSCGTALAAILRPLELVALPESDSGRLRLRIVREGTVPEAWPVGWPVPKKERDSVPKLFDFLEIEIDNSPISDVLNAVGGRLEIPIIYDQAMLDIKHIDPKKTPVSMRAGRTFYHKLLSQTLFNARLDFEVRVDERGKPFLWITPLVVK